MRDSRKKISKKDSLIVWNIDGEIVKKSLDERLKEVRSQARGKTREGDVVSFLKSRIYQNLCPQVRPLPVVAINCNFFFKHNFLNAIC